jgi:hypothetical protein
MHQQLWGYKVEEKLYLGVREQKRLNTAGLNHTQNRSEVYSTPKQLFTYGRGPKITGAPRLQQAVKLRPHGTLSHPSKPYVLSAGTNFQFQTLRLFNHFNKFHLHHLRIIYGHRSMPVAAPSKAWVCSRSLAGIAGSNPTGGMYVCLLWVLCVVR